MKKNNLYTFKRYPLIVVLVFFLIILGAVLEKSWHMTPEIHFRMGISEMKLNHMDKALPHLLIANKSKNSVIHSLSAYQVAKIYSTGTFKDMQKSLFYYEKAADMKMPEAQYELALLYDVGDKIPENRDKAIKLMTEAAKTLPKAKYALAVWIERGYLGTIDQKKAVELYEQAADAGIKNAMKSLISIYHGGYSFFPKNIEKEHYWRNRLNEESKK